MGSTALQTIEAAVEQRFGSSPVHVEAVPLLETFEGQIIWEGTVHVFDLEEGERCYAWGFEDEHTGRLRIITVLHKPPVDSPLAAVRAAIVQGPRERL